MKELFANNSCIYAKQSDGNQDRHTAVQCLPASKRKNAWAVRDLIEAAPGAVENVSNNVVLALSSKSEALLAPFSAQQHYLAVLMCVTDFINIWHYCHDWAQVTSG